MILLYSIFIRIYYFGVYLAAFWNKKAQQWIEGRKALYQNLHQQIPSHQQPIWFHCASVGEFEQALPLIHQCNKKYSQSPILLTFFSPSGYEYAKAKYPDWLIAYLPLDTQKQMSLFIATCKPAMVFVIKYEFWYHMLAELHKKKIPTFLVSGIFRDNQLFFKSYGAFYRKILHFFTHLFVQNESSLHLLQSIQVNHATLAGDTRFDRVVENKNTFFSDHKIENWIDGHKVFMAGSVWDSDIPLLQKIIAGLPADWKIIFAPHEINHFKTHWINEPFITYTTMSDEKARFCIINTMGILSKLYRYADLVYVGGGFGKGIHNILEPAVYAKPILIGPHFHKFDEAHNLVSKGCAFSVNPQNVDFVLHHHIFDKNKYQAIEKQLIEYISTNTNLSEKIMVLIDRFLKVS